MQKGRPGWLSDRAPQVHERRAGLETGNAEADPPEFRGRLPAVGKRATRAPTGSAGVMAAARVEEETILRGSLIERFKRCGRPGCKCARGVGHGPKVYLSVSMPKARPVMVYVPQERVSEIEQLVADYRRTRQLLDEIAAINLRAASTRGADRLSVHGGRRARRCSDRRPAGREHAPVLDRVRACGLCARRTRRSRRSGAERGWC